MIADLEFPREEFQEHHKLLEQAFNFVEEKLQKAQ